LSFFFKEAKQPSAGSGHRGALFPSFFPSTQFHQPSNFIAIGYIDLINVALIAGLRLGTLLSFKYHAISKR